MGLYLFRGAKGGNLPVGRTHARNPTSSPAVAQCLLMRGGLGPTVRAVLMRTTCVGGVPRICDTRVIRGVVHHATVVRVPCGRLCRSQEEAVQATLSLP